MSIDVVRGRAYFKIPREEFSRWCLDGTNFEGGFVIGIGNDNRQSMVNVYFIHEKLKRQVEGARTPEVKVFQVVNPEDRSNTAAG